MENARCAAEERTVPCRGYDLQSARSLAAALKIDLFAAKFLVSRGISSHEDAAEYLYPRLSRLHSPFLLDDIVPAVHRIRRAIDAKERVAVFTDSDIDGLTSLAVIRSILDGAGVPVEQSWPCGDENYGLSIRAIDDFADKGATLLLTFDCGIRDIDEVAYARSKGMDVIVCDHHEQGPELPDAVCVDQKRAGSVYPCRDLAGAGVAMKLCHAVLVSYLPMYGKSFCLILRDGESLDCRVITNGVMTSHGSAGSVDEEMISLAKQSDAVCVWNILVSDSEVLSGAGVPFEPFDHLLVRGGYESGRTSPSDVKASLGLPAALPFGIGELAQEALFDLGFISPKKLSSFLARWLPLVALGTIADVMPVVGENRTIVGCGLKLFAECPLPAIKILNEKFAPVTAKTVAWNISPLLNTPGRIDRTDLSASFLLSRDDSECARLLREISGLNDERKEFLKEKISHYAKELESNGRGAANFIYIKADDVTDGYTGLIAGRLADAHGCPAVVVSAVEGKGIFKGSGRANGIDFLSRVEPFAERFERFGGHASAFGFSARESEIDGIMRDIDRSLDGVVFEKKGRLADFEICDTGEITERSLQILALCEPFGAGNEPPLFFSRGVPVIRFETFGGDGRHGKFLCGGRNTAAIGWGMAAEMREYIETRRDGEAAGDGECLDAADFLYSAEFDQYTKRVRFVIEELL